MKKTATLFEKIYSKSALAKGLVVAFLFSTLFFAGCYEWGQIMQPESATINSFFDVVLTAQDDGNPDNDWSNPDLVDYGLFGVMIPDGWDVEDNIPFDIYCTDPSYDNSGNLVYSAAHSQTLQDSIPAPAGYHWWGAITANEASMVYFESLSFAPRIFTDGQVGQFFLRYAIGDMDFWDRNPADDVSDPMPIIIVDNTGVEEMLAGTNVSFYPNPVSEQLNIQFENYQSEAVQMELIDLTGKVVKSEMLTQRNSQVQVNDLSKGIYFVRLRNGDASTSQKILIK